MLGKSTLSPSLYLRSSQFVTLRHNVRMKVWRRSLKTTAAVTPDEEVGVQMSYKDTQRLFSSLDSSLTHQKGSVTGASILVAGEGNTTLT
jgi:hypothetical protein